MKAYAILDGGGVKGAALVGCLKAAEEEKINFIGYGGTSAGSIVALLACVGFTADELREILINEIDFTKFLSDGGKDLNKLKTLPDNLKSKLSMARYYISNWRRLQRIKKEFGLYEAKLLEDYLEEKIKKRLPPHGEKSITFDSLKWLELPLLKIVASDLHSNKPIIFSASGRDDPNEGVVDQFSGSVIDAVRASMSYPFVFKPFTIGNRHYVDGGLSSNLPLFLFERERQQNGLPVIAFDLVTEKTDRTSEAHFSAFCSDIVTTALDSTEVLFRDTLSNVHYVEVKIPEDIRTLDFSLSSKQRQRLYEIGFNTAMAFFAKQRPQWKVAENRVKEIQAVHALPHLVKPVLEAAARSFAEYKKNSYRHSLNMLEKVRAYVMLPTPDDELMVVYHHGMDNDSDSNLSIALKAGAPGKVWISQKRAPKIMDLSKLETLYEIWGFTEDQKNRIPKDRKAVLAVPIFNLGKAVFDSEKVENYNLMGVFCIDTATPFRNTGWFDREDASVLKRPVLKEAQKWAEILSRILRVGG
ncbi:MAG: patatin-like phospholipase family protein [Blastocatellia bacterium]